MLDRVKSMLKKDEIKIKKPIHIAVTTHGITDWKEKHKKTSKETFEKCFNTAKSLVESQIQNSIRILTVYLLPEKIDDEENYDEFIDIMVDFIASLTNNNEINSNQVKVSVLGKWYDLPTKAIDPIKKVIEETKDYDKFFLNLCLNYDGQEEIVDACKLIIRKVQTEKLDADAVTKQTIKDNIYASYFLHPNVVIINGKQRRLSGLLLWDSAYSRIHFTDKMFPDFSKKDFESCFE